MPYLTYLLNISGKCVSLNVKHGNNRIITKASLTFSKERSLALNNHNQLTICYDNKWESWVKINPVWSLKLISSTKSLSLLVKIPPISRLASRMSNRWGTKHKNSLLWYLSAWKWTIKWVSRNLKLTDSRQKVKTRNWKHDFKTLSTISKKCAEKKEKSRRRLKKWQKELRKWLNKIN